jgi:hypothetical protein
MAGKQRPPLVEGHRCATLSMLRKGSGRKRHRAASMTRTACGLACPASCRSTSGCHGYHARSSLLFPPTRITVPEFGGLVTGGEEQAGFVLDNQAERIQVPMAVRAMHPHRLHSPSPRVSSVITGVPVPLRLPPDPGGRWALRRSRDCCHRASMHEKPARRAAAAGPHRIGRGASRRPCNTPQRRCSSQRRETCSVLTV